MVASGNSSNFNGFQMQLSLAWTSSGKVRPGIFSTGGDFVSLPTLKGHLGSLDLVLVISTTGT